MLPQAIFFDMDDTLLKYNIPLESAWQKACEISLKESQTIKVDELLQQIEIARNWYWSDPERQRTGRLNLLNARTTIVKKALKQLGRNDERTAGNIAVNYANILDGTLDFFPDAEKTLKELVKKKVKLALLTNGAGEVQRAKINRFGLARYFPTCLVEGDLGYGKPDQRVFKMALQKLNVNPNQTWMVGDDLERDIGGAQIAGIFSIWHDYNKTGLPAGSRIIPDKTISHITELLFL
jgi:putative hydrolase of the HAD superfamily